MTSTATIQKWGNSHGIRLSKQILEAAGFPVGDAPISVEISIDGEDGSIKITKAEKTGRARRNIAKLFEGYDGGFEPSEIDWGAPAGKEIW